MADRRIPHLTKSKFVAGLQCRLRLWKQVYTPMPYQKPEPGTPQYEGTRIGELARTCFSGGVLVDNEAYDHKGALERTRALMAEGCPAIFEGAFEHDNQRIRVDILKHVGEGKWALYEVKSSTSIHEEHFDDAAGNARHIPAERDANSVGQSGERAFRRPARRVRSPTGKTIPAHTGTRRDQISIASTGGPRFRAIRFLQRLSTAYARSPAQCRASQKPHHLPTCTRSSPSWVLM
jgi:hypothetical protein